MVSAVTVRIQDSGTVHKKESNPAFGEPGRISQKSSGQKETWRAFGQAKGNPTFQAEGAK